MDYQKALKDFEEFLQNYPLDFEGFHPHFQKAFWEMLLNGGKRFRPALLLAVVESYAPVLLKNAFLPALALECLHTYSLIHDDLPCMDNADLRRGHPTLHKTYDITTATLVGDGLNTFSFYLLTQARLSPENKLKMIEVLSTNGGVGGMIIGQAMDCYFENQKLPLEKLYLIHLNKTAKLIATSLYMGGLVVNLDQKSLHNLYNFGITLGIFFQVRDDIIDCVHTQEEAGKTTQNDSYKNSYVNLLGLDGARDELKRLKETLLQEMEKFPEKLQQNLQWLLKKYFKDEI
ncbi:polyprenyl synthetase family protein [Helicobacter sp. faydin-H20]|uniref:polyprenyl synthetase family protein n=1 Tax=Helicobacter anatolicus TaxID=2905874 RepID=UPI001E61EE8E|nr:polyprenyl synthetase family protein [Helicobacter anatolicus]MCE3036239.1 polyprenyl synthetase family protein [Helicobacter anatolicus]